MAQEVKDAEYYFKKARIAWRRGQWASIEAFLRGEAKTRRVGPGMHEPEDGTGTWDGLRTNTGHVRASLRLDQLDKVLK